MTTLSIPASVRAPLQIKQYVRNGAAPDAEFMGTLATQANFAARWCTHEVARFAHPVPSIPNGSLTNGWRAQWHSSPFAGRLMVTMLCALPKGAAVAPYARCTVQDTAGNVIGTAQFDWGSMGNANDVPNEWATSTLPIRNTAGTIVAMPSDADLRLSFTSGGTRLISAVAYELALASDTNNGYAPQSFAALSPIMAADRADVVDVATSMWKRGAAKLWTYGATTPASYNSTTARNVVNRSSTTVTTATPGVTLDLTERTTKRLASSGVPVTMAVYASATTAAGSVTLKNSSGTALLTCSISAGSAAWYEVSGYLPATVAKYDLHEAAGTSGTITVHGVSLYQYL